MAFEPAKDNEEPQPIRRRSTAQRREEIIEAAVRLFADRGYHGTSINDLCEATGLGKGALYHHIKAKDQILFEIHGRFVDPMIAYGEELLRHPGSPSGQLEDLSRELLTTIARYRYHVVVFFRELNALPPERFAEIREKRRAFERIVEELIQRGIDAGEFEAVPARIGMLAFLGMHNYAHTWLRSDGALTPEEISDYFAHIFIAGVRGEPPKPAAGD